MTGARVQPLGADDPRRLGPYGLLGRLGSGGMGRVYLARPIGTTGRGNGPLVAVKTPLVDGDIGQTDRRRFAREVALARRVDSAYTARVLAADPDAEQPWMASEYIAAPSLAELVRTEGKVPASAVRWVAAGTAEALVTLHDAGIVHRDVKPQNILLPLGGPRLIDFGISHAADLTRTSLTLGTIAFTSPEQARGEPSTEASDVYSLGATLFHLAVGRPPYPHDDDTLRLLVKVQRAELDLSGLPKALAPLVSPCLALDPGARPEPRDVLTEFTTALAGLPESTSGARWLPPRWTSLIEEYARQGRTLDQGTAEDLTENQRTRPVPGPGPTHVYTQAAQEEWERKAREAHEREAEEARAREAREARRRREEELRRRAQAEAEARARREAEAKAAEAKARAEADAKAARERAAEENRRKQQQPPTPSGASGNGPRPSTPSAARASTAGPAAALPPTRTGSGHKSSVDGALTLFFLALAFVVFVWQPWKSDTPSGNPGSSGGSSYGATPTPTPTPEPADLAFRAVDKGDCLTVYDDGYDRWSTSLPEVVDCGTPNAYTRVYAKYSGAVDAGDCDEGIDMHYWLHSSEVSGKIILCLERKFATGQCFPALVKADGNATADLMELWRCAADTVPQGKNEVMQITGFLGPGQNCGKDYWTWKIDGGDNVLCTRGT
ncbi:serine/threonine-protein kinase [Streptomyces sp. NPDC048604]|uniref:serine/threonine-protein kinase n=1 Tax=Streptomyces sp. NPDC048604 TaxID=3365578 RepID=UPI0037199C1B